MNSKIQETLGLHKMEYWIPRVTPRQNILSSSLVIVILKEKISVAKSAFSPKLFSYMRYFLISLSSILTFSVLRVICIFQFTDIQQVQISNSYFYHKCFWVLTVLLNIHAHYFLKTLHRTGRYKRCMYKNTIWKHLWEWCSDWRYFVFMVRGKVFLMVHKTYLYFLFMFNVFY